MTAYRIRKWSEHFENSRSRVVDKLSWVPVPNGHDGEGFATIMAHEKGAEIFAAWILLLQVASRCETRGDLIRGDGKPHDAASLALRTRAKAKWFDSAFPILLQVKWIEEFTFECQGGNGTVTGEQRSSAEGKKEGKEGNGSEPPPARNSTDEEFIESLKSNPAYRGIDITRELGKMEAWLQTPKARGRKRTRAFVVNWLNKCDPAMLPLNGSNATKTDPEGWREFLSTLEPPQPYREHRFAPEFLRSDFLKLR